MNKGLVQVFAVLCHYGAGKCECVAECNSYSTAVEAIEHYSCNDPAGVYYRIELRYKVVES